MTTLVRWAISMASARVRVDKLSSPSLIRIITRRTTSGWSPGERLDDLRFVVEGHHKGFIFIAAQHAKQKINRSVLLKFDAVADAVGSVQQHADAQRQIGLLAEVTDFLWSFVVPNL